MPTLEHIGQTLERLDPALTRLLLPIEHESDYTHALTVARAFWDSPSPAARAFMSVLTERIEAYEARHHPLEEAEPHEVLEFLMEARGLTQEDLAAAIGIHQSTLSRILTGKRKPTLEQVRKLAEYFGVSLEVLV